MINKIAKITLYVNNQEEAKAFWTEKAGFVVKTELPMGPNIKWLEVGPSESEFTTFVLYEKKLMQTQNPSTNLGHPSIILSTTDIEKTYQDMKDNGIDVEDLNRMPYGTMFNFKDQDGNSYMIREDK
ncbi:MAG: VOC family protein [Mobilitalea sp.]